MDSVTNREAGLSPIFRAVLIWLGLLALTVSTVLLHGVHLIFPGLLLALAIAAAKSVLVITYYMHLKYEDPALRRLVVMTIGILVVILAVIFTDPLYR